MTLQALLPTRVLTPRGFAEGLGVLIAGGLIVDVVEHGSCPAAAERVELEGDLLPGFIDLQVNGGGGVLFNDDPSVETIAAIGRAHRRFGTTGFLPTLITDDLDTVVRAIAAVASAIVQGVPGVLGIHIEGPFLNVARKGIHDETKFRRLDRDAVDLLSSSNLGVTLVTLAPELAFAGAIRALTDRGVIVAAGHSEATYEEVGVAREEGLSGFTHLFNAMSQLGSRAPGVVGAALDDAASWCGVIVDGHHVHPASLRIAYRAKGADMLVLVTDAMPTVGSNGASFTLGAREIVAIGGRCTAADGTLAGSGLNMAQAVRNAVSMMHVDVPTAVRMASANPARALRLEAVTGTIAAGRRADLVLVDERLHVTRSWIGGVTERHV